MPINCADRSKFQRCTCARLCTVYDVKSFWLNVLDNVNAPLENVHIYTEKYKQKKT